MSYLKSSLKQDQTKLSKKKADLTECSVLSSLEKKSRKSLLREQDERYSKERSKSIHSLLSTTSTHDDRSVDTTKRPEFDQLSILSLGRDSFRRGSINSPNANSSPSSYSNRKALNDEMHQRAAGHNSSKKKTKKVGALEEYNPDKDYFSEQSLQGELSSSFHSYQYNQLRDNSKSSGSGPSSGRNAIESDSDDDHNTNLSDNEGTSPLEQASLLYQSSIFDELDDLITNKNIQSPHDASEDFHEPRELDDHDPIATPDRGKGSEVPSHVHNSPAFVYMSRKGNIDSIMSKFGGTKGAKGDGAVAEDGNGKSNESGNLSLHAFDDKDAMGNSQDAMGNSQDAKGTLLGSLGSTPPTSPQPKIGLTMAGHSLASNKTRRIQQVRASLHCIIALTS